MRTLLKSNHQTDAWLFVKGWPNGRFPEPIILLIILLPSRPGPFLNPSNIVQHNHG